MRVTNNRFDRKKTGFVLIIICFRPAVPGGVCAGPPLLRGDGGGGSPLLPHTQHQVQTTGHYTVRKEQSNNWRLSKRNA